MSEIFEAEVSTDGVEPSVERSGDGEDHGQAPGEEHQFEEISLPLGAPAKQFYEKLFRGHEKTGGRREGGGRDIIKVNAVCKIGSCQKKVTGTDSYFLFKEHYQKAHSEALRPLESGEGEEEDPMVAGEAEATELLSADFESFESVEELPFDKSDVDFFQQLYLGHEAVPSTRRNGSSVYKFSATCKKCLKKVTALGSVGVFKQHYRKNHGLASTEAAAAAQSIEEDGTPRISSAKYFFDTAYSNQEVCKEPKPAEGKRGTTRFSGNCNVCERRITGVDSFFNFRQHYTRAHEGASPQNGLGEFIVPDVPADAMNFDENGDSTAAPVITPKISAKRWFQCMFTDHLCTKQAVPNKRGMRRRFTGVCRIPDCQKTVGGTDTFHNFQHHYSLYHKDVEFDGSDEVDLTEIVNAAVVDEEEYVSKRSRGVKGSVSFEALDPASVKERRAQRQEKFNRNVVMYMVDAMIPAANLCVPSFHRLFVELDDITTCPTAETVVEKLLPELHQQMRELVLRDCHDTTSAHITVWTDNSYMAVIARLLSNEWKLNTRVLTVKRNASGSAFQQQVVVKHTITALADFGLKDRVSAVSETNNSETTKQISFPSSLETESPRKRKDDIATKSQVPSRELSTKIMDQLKIKHDGFEVSSILHRLDACLDRAVRSTSALVKALKKLADNTTTDKKRLSPWAAVFQSTLSAKQAQWELAKGSKFSANELGIMEEFHGVAQFLQEFCSRMHYPETTVSEIIPSINGLKNFLTRCESETIGLRDFVSEFSQGIEETFQDVYSDQLCLTAAVLHPEHKLSWITSDNKEQRTDEIRQILLNQISEAKKPPVAAHNLYKRTRLSSAAVDAAGTGDGNAKAELDSYIAGEGDLAQNNGGVSNPLDFWRTNDTKYPRLAKLARSALVVPISDLVHPRLASIVEKDSLLDNFDADLDMLLFCHANQEVGADLSKGNQSG